MAEKPHLVAGGDPSASGKIDRPLNARVIDQHIEPLKLWRNPGKQLRPLTRIRDVAGFDM